MRWGGKWWCPRWLSGVWPRHCSLVGLVVSVWVCLVTLAHLSLQPAPLLSRQPCRRGSPGAPDGTVLLGDNVDLSGTGVLSQRERRGVLGAEGVVLHQLREVPGMRDGDAAGSRVSKLPVKVGPDQRVLLTNEDIFDEAGNDFVVFEDEASLRKMRARDRRTSEDSYLVGFSAREISAGTKTEISMGKEKFFQSFSSGYAVYSTGVSTENDAQETQLQRAPVSSNLKTDPEHPFPPPHPLDYPSTPSRLDMRHVMNPRHPSRVRTRTRNTQGDVETLLRSNHVGYHQHHTSQDLQRSRGTLPHHPPQPSDYSFAPAQSQSHLTRKNHDTLRAESLRRPQTFDSPVAPRVDSRVGVPEQASLLMDMEDDVIAVGTRLKADGFLLYAYNVTASDALPMDREVPDTRPEG